MTARAARRSPAILAGALLAFAAIFVALGVWQVERLTWKHALIATVEARTSAAPVAAPGPGTWAGINAMDDAYRHVRVRGQFDYDRETLVRAVSDLGSGYWVLTPLDTGAFTVLVNRGFIAQSARDAQRPEVRGPVTITGLLRITEPGGGFLHANDPQAGNWYSRDVAAIAHSSGLSRAAPYFIDADAARNAPGEPVGGLTVVRFADNHAVYALTWFAMALLCLGGAWHIAGETRRPLRAMA
ncbi:Surfeit locus 1 family protein [Novosphingobium sp. PC22D]|uniref:SURF1 family protein n=1 Tax=Novosphingobium sp. PC22D TaxID=1962403 RepID=UPI000BF07CD6|nr:SURF1 family protein [Novosphingobium sp. PC22D]PEQ13839.1 Surfeit locus 1 family protein [Novosphingobium sp. PC22D]